MEASDPERERMRLLELYAGMTDEQLDDLASDWESLTEPARLALKQAVAHRGMCLEFEEADRPGPAEPPGELVTIREFDSFQEAVLARGLLESVGIVAALADTRDRPLEGSSCGSCGPFRLRSRREDAESAAEILDAPTLEDPEAPD